jgi:orotidine 5'-phosphate decarboxylase subfamily 1
MSTMQTKFLTYEERLKSISNPSAKKLFHIISSKKTNLALSADVTRSTDLLQLADGTGPHICLLKTHIDILEDFSWDVVKKLRNLADKHGFLIFEDRKFADIGNTVRLQYEKGIYRIVEWADFINAYVLPGPGIIEGLQTVGLAKGRGLLLLAQLSSKGSLAHGSFTEQTIKMAEEYPDFVAGFISQEKLSNHPAWIYATPGVQRASSGDTLGQQYNTPEKVISKGSDVIIVGRGIYEANQQEGWRAYLNRTT